MHTTAPRADVAIIGGSGLAGLPLTEALSLDPVLTPYGEVGGIVIGGMSGCRVAFLPRHGSGHSVPPHRLNSRAQLWALASLGIRILVSTNAVGGLTPDTSPGDLVLTDQLIDRTAGRADTYFDGAPGTAWAGEVEHLPFAEPYSRPLREHAHAAMSRIGLSVHPAGTSVVVQGPRFGTRAEAAWHRSMGAQIVNMTQLPEAALAAELGFAHVNIALVTDSDTEHGEGADDTSATAERVFAVMAAATPRLIAAIRAVLTDLPDVPRPASSLSKGASRSILSRPVLGAVQGAPTQAGRSQS